jgi:hypothetical protein
MMGKIQVICDPDGEFLVFTLCVSASVGIKFQAAEQGHHELFPARTGLRQAEGFLNAFGKSLVVHC